MLEANSRPDSSSLRFVSIIQYLVFRLLRIDMSTKNDGTARLQPNTNLAHRLWQVLLDIVVDPPKYILRQRLILQKCLIRGPYRQDARLDRARMEMTNAVLRLGGPADQHACLLRQRMRCHVFTNYRRYFFNVLYLD